MPGQKAVYLFIYMSMILTLEEAQFKVKITLNNLIMVFKKMLILMRLGQASPDRSRAKLSQVGSSNAHLMGQSREHSL